MKEKELCGAWMPRKQERCARLAGHKSQCRSRQTLETRRAYNVAYRASHREETRAYNAAYDASHREERRAYDASRRRRREERRAYHAAYAASHREERRAYDASHAIERNVKDLLRRAGMTLEEVMAL